ncbi:acyl-CoA thioesterase [Chloracidobacterium sp. MS 40/45]|uniref:acyl-CoA thioesterase n=1 Tax=Chloracidobacterium aggregatum TaxID=2851959 RepID=UPI001B8CC2E3|nr:acyl-CoA thioesterase [Chloracidobacterium aggregatum]QUW01393.1 acyl-CoA thioesterase [Chloracidobacterium sp. MS 40/45]
MPERILPATPAIRTTMLPRDTNALGTIFGGVILSYIDLAGAIEARRIAVHRYVTVAMREVVFVAPVYVGDTVSFYAQVETIGRTSITVRVTVDAERMREPNTVVRVTEADVIYVAMSDDGRPTPIFPESTPPAPTTV